MTCGIPFVLRVFIFLLSACLHCLVEMFPVLCHACEWQVCQLTNEEMGSCRDLLLSVCVAIVLLSN